MTRAVNPLQQLHLSRSLRGRILRTQVDASGKPQIARQYDDGEVIASAEDVPRVLRQAFRARLRKAGIPFDVAAQNFIDRLAARFSEAQPGEIITDSFRGVSVRMPKIEAEDLVTVTYRQDDIQFARLCYKIALEAAALALGTEAMSQPEYDAARSCARHGTLSPAPIVDIRRPMLPGPDPDAAQSHTVAVFNDGSFLKVQVAFFECYVVEVSLGPSIADSRIPQSPRALKRTFAFGDVE